MGPVLHCPAEVIVDAGAVTVRVLVDVAVVVTSQRFAFPGLGVAAARRARVEAMQKKAEVARWNILQYVDYSLLERLLKLGKDWPSYSCIYRKLEVFAAQDLSDKHPRN